MAVGAVSGAHHRGALFRVLAGVRGSRRRAQRGDPLAGAPRQGRTLVYFSAHRYVGCMISPKSIEQGDTGRCDQNGSG